MWCPISPQCHQLLLLLVFFNIADLSPMKWLSFFVSICISPNHLDLYLSAQMHVSPTPSSNSQFWNYLPGDSSRWHNLKTQPSRLTPPTPTSEAKLKSRLSPVPLTNQLQIGDSKGPFLDYINLLEHNTKLRETFYLLHYWLIINRNKSGTARWRKWTGRSTWDEVWCFMLSGWTTVPTTCVHQTRRSQNPILSSFYWGFLTLVWLMKSSPFVDWIWSLDPLKVSTH